MSRNLCSVKDCKNTKHEKPFLSFHFFPIKEPERLKQWVDFCENQIITDLFSKNDPRLEHKSICSEHFEDNKYNNPMKKIRLMCNAVPTLRPNQKKRTNSGTDHKPPVHMIPSEILLRTNISRRCLPNRNKFSEQISSSLDQTSTSSLDFKSHFQSSSAQTQSPDQSSTHTSKPNPIIRHLSSQHIKYENEVRSLREKLAKSRKQAMNLRYRLKRMNPIGNTRKSKLNFILRSMKSLSEDLLNPIMSEMIEYHLISAFLNKPRVAKWSDRMKKFCADLYHKSPTAYSFLQKTITLPTKKTIMKFTEDRIQMAKNETFKKTSDDQNKQTNDILSETSAKFSEQQVITLDPIDDLLSNNTLNYINIEYTTCDQTNEQLIEENCIDLNQLDSNITTNDTIDSNSIQTTRITFAEKFGSEIKTYSRNK